MLGHNIAHGFPNKKTREPPNNAHASFKVLECDRKLHRTHLCIHNHV